MIRALTYVSRGIIDLPNGPRLLTQSFVGGVWQWTTEVIRSNTTYHRSMSGRSVRGPAPEEVVSGATKLPYLRRLGR